MPARIHALCLGEFWCVWVHDVHADVGGESVFLRVSMPLCVCVCLVSGMLVGTSVSVGESSVSVSMTVFWCLCVSSIFGRGRLARQD